MITLTFDDGYKNIYQNAYPILREFNFKAVLFMITGLARFEGSLLMDLNELKELRSDGWEINPHTVTHPDLTKITKDEVIWEIENSREWIINSGLGHPVAFAYPYGRFNDFVKKIVEENYHYARTVEQGLNELDFRRNPALKAYTLWGSTRDGSLDLCKRKVNEAVRDGKWLIIILHGVVKNPNHYKIDPIHGWVSVLTFRDFISYLKQKNVRPITFKETMSKF